MDDNIIKVIKEKFDALPKSIQEIIISTHYQDTLIEIGKQYRLNVEQMGILERETTLVMMGLTPTKDFEKELTRELKVDNVKGFQVTKDINEKIFLKIRELLKLMNTPAGEKPVLDEIEETEEINNGDENNDILKSAGIEIIPEKLELETASTYRDEGNLIENREDLLKKIEKPETIDPILTEKLSGSVKIGMVKTEHSLSNITPSSTPTSGPKIDPYREIPE